MSYLNRIRLGRTPQSLPLKGQVPNSAGGHAWAVDDWARLRRFLVLGTEGGSFYASEPRLTRENAAAVEGCLGARRPAHGRGDRRASADAGRAPKNDPALFALAMAAGLGDEATRRPRSPRCREVCRTGTHLFQFATYVEELPRLGSWAAPCGRLVVCAPAAGRARPPGGQVPPA